MKRLIALFLSCLMLFGCLAGCAQTLDTGAHTLSIVTTIFPVYDWVRSIVGDTDVEVTMLLDNGVDLHSYQPTADDIIRISSCDIFIYVGGESDAWVQDALLDPANPDRIVIDLMDVLGDHAKEEESVEGMQPEDEAEDGEEEAEYDEHIWLSLQNAMILCRTIADSIATADPEHQELYQAGCDSYITRLQALDAEYQQAVDAAAFKTLVFADRFPFRYLTDDYGLSYYAAFSGCSAESEASFETVIFLADKIDELGLGSIIKLETSDGAIAETVRDNTNSKDQEILTLNSLQSTTSDDVSVGVTYLDTMQANLSVLQKALA